MITLHLGLHFDNLVFAASKPASGGQIYAGPRRLLHWIEQQCGLSGAVENTDYLRIELYRQALTQVLETAQKPPFYRDSFHADRFATAAGLLTWRDELLYAGWNFEAPAGCPARLADLAAVELLFQKKMTASEVPAAALGLADRWEQALLWLTRRDVPLDRIILYEPEYLQPPVIQRLLTMLMQKGVPVDTKTIEPAAAAGSDLAWLQHRLAGEKSEKKPAAGDGSLLILSARRDSDAAVFLAQWLAKNESWNPVLLLPEMNRVLEQALLQEGFPAMGVLSASLARPSLQALKLAPAFLWEPVDVFKVMEFVTLPLKPLDDGLSLEIARVLAEKPGLFSDTWFAAVFDYLERPGLPDSVREQYEFWFSRRRYPADGSCPKRDAVDLYDFLHRWALDMFRDAQSVTLLVLAEQARRIRDLLDLLPEQRLGYLELERIIRTIYEPAPVQLGVAEVNHFPYVHAPGALAAPAETVIWWNCNFDASAPAPDHWLLEERNWLAGRGAEPDHPRQESRRRQQVEQRPVLQAQNRLILVTPEQTDGADALPGLLLSDIEAAFERSKSLFFSLDKPEERAALEALGRLPDTARLDVRTGAGVRPHLAIPRPERIAKSEYETPTNLEQLFYYPHRWFFRQKLRFFPPSLLSVSRDQTLLGSLAHRFLEFLLQEADCLLWQKTELYYWIDKKAESLLEREGATLLLYGREPERHQFLNRVKNAAWNLLSQIRTNGWTIFETEKELLGDFSGIPVKGKADLVLRRDDNEWAIVDLKWSGARRRKEMIKNGEDLQLVLYAHLLPPLENWAHTAYFILEEGKMIARNKEAFRDAVVAESLWDSHTEACEAIFSRMERTLAWRQSQIRGGLLELRTARSAPELEAIYAGELLDLLEMKYEDARWDDYRVLLT